MPVVAKGTAVLLLRPMWAAVKRALFVRGNMPLLGSIGRQTIGENKWWRQILQLLKNKPLSRSRRRFLDNEMSFIVVVGACWHLPRGFGNIEAVVWAAVSWVLNNCALRRANRLVLGRSLLSPGDSLGVRTLQFGRRH